MTAEEWVGRLYLTSRYKQRNSYPNGETLDGDLVNSELLAERLSIGDFPGYKKINLTKLQLDAVVQQNIDSWRSALSSIKGIYLVTDILTGKLYVGKADGEAGIWGRWCTYSSTAMAITWRSKRSLESMRRRSVKTIYASPCWRLLICTQ
ncbi:hypothetical protein [Pseudomonas fluorescens]|uniref:hypothetical protein n=1 Tax=Pseudomonas fluorescens TaxID=294 RepID=UPI0017861BDC|nr:hypothetical protein [Pseudomonas fluorescens]